jgi:hypothetical protein
LKRRSPATGTGSHHQPQALLAGEGALLRRGSIFHNQSWVEFALFDVTEKLPVGGKTEKECLKR